MISRKAAAEERAASPGRLARLAGELESAVRAMVEIAAKAGYGVKGSG